MDSKFIKPSVFNTDPNLKQACKSGGIGIVHFRIS